MAKISNCDHDDSVVVWLRIRDEKCPLCEAQKQISELQTERDDLQGQLDDAQREIAESGKGDD
jgi:hypothetical protein